MRVKKYAAPTMPEAMDRIRKELGTQAVILNSREVAKGGFFGFFKKRYIEVVAGLDPELAPQQENKKETIAAKQSKSPTNHQSNVVLNEVKQLRKLMATQAVDSASFPAAYQVVYHDLCAQDVDEALAQQLVVDVIHQHENGNGLVTDQQRIWQDVKMAIESQLGSIDVRTNPESYQIIQFVGPTGAGKTTTIAKIAASSLLNDKKQVALITADTYRISAIDQLKTYADILNVPLEVAYNANDYEKAVQNLASYDLILVDTAGRNFLEQAYVQDLQNTLTFNKDTCFCLVLSLTVKAGDLLAMYEQFQHLPVTHLIFTKIDETRQYGSLLTLALKHSLNIAFLTNGQDVPDDIIKPSSSMLSYLVAGDQGAH